MVKKIKTMTSGLGSGSGGYKKITRSSMITILIIIYIVNHDVLIRKKTRDFLAGFLHF